MDAPHITVVRDRYVRSWPRHPEGPRAYVLPLAGALTRTYSTGAHFMQYVAPNARRLSGEALDHLPDGVTMSCIALDVDCAETHGTDQRPPEKWRAEQLARCAELWAVHRGAIMYWTRGGYRLVWTLPEPTVIRTREDAQKWRQDYAIVVQYMRRRFGIEADPACSDWTRLFRLPRSTRDPGGKPEDHGIVVDPQRIEPLRIQPTHEDVETARQASKAFQVAKRLDFTPSNHNDGQGLLYHLLRARGDIIRPHGDAYVIRCPREREHSCGRTGDGSTVLYLPASGEEVGAIHCLHAHCSGMTVRDWLREFDGTEKDAAREAAGIAGAA